MLRTGSVTERMVAMQSLKRGPMVRGLKLGQDECPRHNDVGNESRNARRRIFPTFVFGNSSRKYTCFGTL